LNRSLETGIAEFLSAPMTKGSRDSQLDLAQEIDPDHDMIASA